MITVKTFTPTLPSRKQRRVKTSVGKKEWEWQECSDVWLQKNFSMLYFSVEKISCDTNLRILRKLLKNYRKKQRGNQRITLPRIEILISQQKAIITSSVRCWFKKNRYCYRKTSRVMFYIKRDEITDVVYNGTHVDCAEIS